VTRVLWLRPEGRTVKVPTGWESIWIPIVKTTCLHYERPNYSRFEALAFTSVSAVQCFKERDELSGKIIYAVGPSTAKEIGLPSVRVPANYTVLSMVRSALSDGIRSLLAFRSLSAGDSAAKEMAGKVNYVEIKDYKVEVLESGLQEVRTMLSKREVDVIVLTSSSIASLVVDYIPRDVRVISIGPETSKILRARDVDFIEAEEHDVEGLTRVLEGIS